MTTTQPDLVQPHADSMTTGASVAAEPSPGRQATYAEQVRAALNQAMRADDRVLLFGEDVGLYGGAFGVSAGMLEEFGADRVRDTPISELGIVGAAVGLALCGMRPIVEIQFSDFTAQAMDQIVNQAAKIHFMLGGAANVPMVLRAPGGSGTGAAAQHSQSLEAWFAHVPGLKVVMPSSAADVGGLLLSAIEDPDPVIFLEHKLLYKKTGAVPDTLTPIPLGKSFVARKGTDVTVVATGIMVSRALEAAESLAAEEISVEVIDPRTVSPLDDRPILDSVQTTGRVVLVQEAPRDLGFMAEVATRIAETETLYYLTAPIVRLAGLNAPIPYAPELEKASVPQVADIIAACHGLLKGN
jgi:pyruvate/2-oxoglutarate/acetoin dehydrogenase E1 component